MESLFGNIDLKPTKALRQPKKEKAAKKPSLAPDIDLSSEQMFGSDFAVKAKEKKKASEEADEASVEKQLKSKKLSLDERLSIINSNVLKILGKQKNNIVVIKDADAFSAYVDSAIASGRIAVDTETNNSTDAATCKLMGLCLYYPGGKQAYIPINHTDKERNKLAWQLTEEDCRKQLQKIVDSKVDVIMHNGKFDYQVLKHTCGVAIPPTWDTIIGAQIMDENKFSDKNSSLKSIYTSYIDKDQEKYAIDQLFNNIPYNYVDPNIFAYYAATDALMTDRVYQWEMETFFDKPENADLLKLCREIEMPEVQVVAETEAYGVYIDQKFGESLKAKYNGVLHEIDVEMADLLLSSQPIIDAWRVSPDANAQARQYVSEKTKMSPEKIEKTYPNVDESGRRYKLGKAKVEQLEEPINLASPTQFAILLFDILEAPTQNNSRAVGEDEIKAILDALKIKESLTDKQTKAKALCEAILRRRGIVKLLSTYIDVIPDLAKHWPDGRIRYRLNSMGTATGRFSSGGKFRFLDENEKPTVLNSINSQNIPSRGEGAEVRMLFKATPGYRIVGSDYSGQELRLAAYLSQDKKLLDAYANDQDAYAIIASEMFGLPYEECLEFYPEGSEIEIDGQKVICGHKTHLNKEGKARRSVGKTMVLAGNYGMSGAGAGALMGKTAKEGSELLDKYFKMFDGLGGAIAKAKEKLHKDGYVTGIMGRRRRLPDISLPSYSVSLKDIDVDLANFNPFLNCGNRETVDPKIKKWQDRIKDEIDRYQAWRVKIAKKEGRTYKRSEEMSNKTCNELIVEAAKEGVLIQPNTGRIAQAERQCFNATVQGSAGTLTKKAMIDIFNDPILKSCDTHILISVHDEVLVECKEECADVVEKRLPEVMVNAAKELGIVSPKMVCDPYNVDRWYADVEAASVLDYFNKKEHGDEKKGIARMSRDDAMKATIDHFSEIPEEAIRKTVETGCDLAF